MEGLCTTVGYIAMERRNDIRIEKTINLDYVAADKHLVELSFVILK